LHTDDVEVYVVDRSDSPHIIDAIDPKDVVCLEAARFTATGNYKDDDEALRHVTQWVHDAHVWQDEIARYATPCMIVLAPPSLSLLNHASDIVHAGASVWESPSASRLADEDLASFVYNELRYASGGFAFEMLGEDDNVLSADRYAFPAEDTRGFSGGLPFKLTEKDYYRLVEQSNLTDADWRKDD